MSERPTTEHALEYLASTNSRATYARARRGIEPEARRYVGSLAAELLAVTEALRAASATMWRVSKYDRMTISHAAELQACAKELDRLAAHGDTPEPQACGHPWSAFNAEHGVCVECEMAAGAAEATEETSP